MTTDLYLQRPVHITKTPTDSKRVGWFEGLLATWDLDRDGERFARGSFTQSILDWLGRSDTPPVLYNHDRDSNPENVIGKLETMREDDEGLRVTGKINVGSRKGRAAYEAMLAGALRSMSIGFQVKRGDWHLDDAYIRVFDRAEILEATLTPTLANPHARVTAVKIGTNANVKVKTTIDANLYGRDDADQELREYMAKIAAAEATTKRWSPYDPPTIDDMRRELIAEVRRERLERERLQKIVAANDDRARRMAHGRTLAEELAEDEARYERDVAAIRQRDEERGREVAQREAVDEAVRRGALDMYGRW